MPTAAPSSPRFSWWPVLALVAAGLLAYSRSFSGVFVFDDPDSILHNPSIRHLGDLRAVLTPPSAQGQTVAGRPMLNLSLALNYALSGTAVGSYHAVNLLIHLLAGLTLWGILRRLWPGRSGLAFAAALLWIVHPLQTEAVTYIVQRAESLMGLFYLLTLYCYIRYTEAGEPGGRRARGWGALAVACCLLGMGTKEVMASAPVIVLLYDRTFRSGTFRSAWRRHWPVLLGLAATWIWLVLLVASNRERGGTQGLGLGVSWGTYVLTQFPAVLHYLRLVIWPHPQIFDYGAAWVTVAAAAPSMVCVLVLAFGSLWLLFRRPPDQRAGALGGEGLGFAGACFFAWLAPTSLVPGIRLTMAEHRMYLPLAAVLAVLVAGLGVRWVGPDGKRRRSAAASVGLAALALIALTLHRNELYASELGLWRATVAERPLNPYAHNDLGDLLQQNGQLAEAGAEFREALRLNPNYPEASNNLANVLRAEGRPEEAVPLFQRAIAGKPVFAEAYNNLGVALTDLGRLYEAVAAFEAALKLNSDYASAHYNLGIVLARIGRYPEAIAAYQSALRLDPRSAETRLNLGNALVAAGRSDEAIAQYQAILKLRPAYAEAHFNLGNALALAGRLGEAAGEYEEALRLKPDFAAARLNLDRLRALAAPGP